MIAKGGAGRLIKCVCVPPHLWLGIERAIRRDGCE